MRGEVRKVKIFNSELVLKRGVVLSVWRVYKRKKVKVWKLLWKIVFIRWCLWLYGFIFYYER